MTPAETLAKHTASAALATQPMDKHGFMAQIDACRREVANWPAWMHRTVSAPNWMGRQGWDD